MLYARIVYTRMKQWEFFFKWKRERKLNVEKSLKRKFLLEYEPKNKNVLNEFSSLK